MRIGVIGAGAVGGSLAALLAGFGHSVAVTARGAHLEAIRSDGIRLDGAWGAVEARVEASEVLQSRPDLAIVATNAHDAVAAIQANLSALEGNRVLVIQNGIDGIGGARALLPTARVAGGLAVFAASYLSPGRVTITAPGPTFVGGDNLAAREIIAALAPPLDLALVDNFAGAQWSKLVVNQVNALPAITGLSAQAVIADHSLRRILVESMRETIRVGRAAGISFGRVSGLSDSVLRVFEHTPFALAQALPLLMSRRMGSTPNPGSTLQSVRRGQATEIDYLNGAVVREGRLVGVATPVNAALVELVHDVESSGRFIPKTSLSLERLRG